LKRLLLLFTVATMLATLGIGTAAYAVTCLPAPKANHGTCDGTDGPDNIEGDDSHNEIRAQGGRDFVYGKGGDDDLYGNGGPDHLYGGTGNDNLYGGGGNDKLFDEKGPLTQDAADIDNLYGGDGNDTLNAHDGDELDKLDGGTNDPVSETNRGDYCIGEANDKYYNCEGGEKYSVGNNQLIPVWSGNTGPG
jgi:Ca2+-binding RTX toxin-like protein